MTMQLGAGALAFAGELDACGDIAAVASLFEAAAARVGMTASACGMVSGPMVLRAQPFHFVNWPADWLRLYQERGFVKIDAVPRWAMVSGAPVAARLLRTSAGDSGGCIASLACSRITAANSSGSRS